MHSQHADSDTGLLSLPQHDLAHGERRYIYKGIGGGGSTPSVMTNAVRIAQTLSENFVSTDR